MARIDWNSVRDGFELPARVCMGDEPGRKRTLFYYLCSIRGKGASDEEIAAEAERVNETVFDPPLPMGIVHGRVRSVITRYRPGQGLFHGSSVAEKEWATELPDVPERESAEIEAPDMTPEEQARAWIRACFMEDDIVCMARSIDGTWKGDFACSGLVPMYAGTWLGGSGFDPLDGFLASCAPDAGCWCVVNPIKPATTTRNNADIASFRNVLIESDELAIPDQLERLLALFGPEAPEAFANSLMAITYSGGRSLHGIVRLGEGNAVSYSRTVRTLFMYCEKNGLPPDKECSNPSRLTRLPGAMRKGRIQRLVWLHG